MENLNHYIKSYQEQLQKGDIKEAYTGLIKYVTKLRTTLSGKLGHSYSFGNIFQGYMDYTYFYYTNDFLKERKLKMGLVLHHSEMRFEVWLLGQTIAIQEKYWQYFKTTQWNEGRTTKPTYSILVTVLIEQPDFNNLAMLSIQIEKKLVHVTQEIIHDVQQVR